MTNLWTEQRYPLSQTNHVTNELRPHHGALLYFMPQLSFLSLIKNCLRDSFPERAGCQQFSVTGESSWMVDCHARLRHCYARGEE
jgi:hypothetical protein